MYCCDSFKWAIEKAGERGISIIVHGDEFYYQFRCIAHQQKEEVYQAIQDGEIDFAIKAMPLSRSQQINYCLQCGMKLSKLVKKYPLEYRALSEKHSVYIDTDILENTKQVEIRLTKKATQSFWSRLFQK